MRNVKRILVPIDFSPEAEKALSYAASLARQIDGELIVLHVIENLDEDDGLLQFIMPPEGWPFFGDEPARRPIDVIMRDRALDLWNFIHRAVRGEAPQKLKKLVRIGIPTKEIAAVAREENIDLIVFELRNHFLFPNLANRKLLRMIEKLPYPVLLAPPIHEATPIKGKPVLAFYPMPSENPI